MKTILTFLAILGVTATGLATTTINNVNKHAYGANFGWGQCPACAFAAISKK